MLSVTDCAKYLVKASRLRGVHTISSVSAKKHMRAYDDGDGDGDDAHNDNEHDEHRDNQLMMMRIINMMR